MTDTEHDWGALLNPKRRTIKQLRDDHIQQEENLWFKGALTLEEIEEEVYFLIRGYEHYGQEKEED